MNLNITGMYEHLSKLESIVYKKLNAEWSKIPRNSRRNFCKDIFPGIPEREFLWPCRHRTATELTSKDRPDKGVSHL